MEINLTGILAWRIVALVYCFVYWKVEKMQAGTLIGGESIKNIVCFPDTTQGICIPEYEQLDYRNTSEISGYTIEKSSYSITGKDSVTGHPRMLNAGKVIVKQGDKIVLELYRDALASFPMTIVNKNGVDYLWYAPTYHKHAIINLQTGKEVLTYTSSFCPRSFLISPDGNTMAVFGCYWASSGEVKFLNLAKFPQEITELPIKGYEDYNYMEHLYKVKWLSPTVFFGANSAYYEAYEESEDTDADDKFSGKLLMEWDLRDRADKKMHKSDLELFSKLFITQRLGDEMHILEYRDFDWERDKRYGN